MSPKLLAIVGYVAILLNFGLCFLNQQRSSAPGLSFPRMQQCARTAQPIASLFPLEEHGCVKLLVSLFCQALPAPWLARPLLFTSVPRDWNPSIISTAARV
ncbi:uncharacterized protein CIMG_03569 [Coccidioides immitis RS]|uniref:Uncharacterized protein n=1 Tax=Coccidioides immitis (strain RS) TaxID=246410 RepID=J3KBN2_COCIM|nr:uncharacterized protein CIMG_03569 [Coccidioides immitis RS]EAS32545.3 hypothetical protein CIMG_03569 [Coccidioides immitis RS]